MMDRQLTWPYGLLVLVTLGCNASIDLEAERQALLDTDRAWAQAASEGADIDSVLSYWTDDAKVFPPGEPVREGRDAIRAMLSSNMGVPGFSVTWEPEEAVVAPGGQMGYTIGQNRFTVPGPDGNLMTLENRYVTVWRKEADGAWRCVIDMFNPGPSADSP